MTTAQATAEQSTTGQAPAGESAFGVCSGRLRIAWRVSRSAWPHPASREGPDPEIEFRIETASAGWVAATTNVPGTELPCSRGAATIRTEGDLLHIDAPGLLSATFRDGAPLYAFTPMLAALGIPGGRYELIALPNGPTD